MWLFCFLWQNKCVPSLDEVLCASRCGGREGGGACAVRARVRWPPEDFSLGYRTEAGVFVNSLRAYTTARLYMVKLP
jgi:hypothetical protein